MAHYKCGGCRARLQVSGRPAELVGDLCPECGSLLEPVAELTELVGFRSIQSVEGDADPVRSASHQRIADSVDRFLTRRTGTLERDRAEAECWRDDDDLGRAAAVTLPVPRIRS